MPTPKLSHLLAVGAVATAATFAASGPAAAADANPTVTNDGGTYTLKMHSHTTSETYTPKGGTATTEEPKSEPKVGDAFSFNEDLTQGGAKIGSDKGTCTVTGAKSVKCVVAVTFTNGTLAVEGTPEFTEDDSAPSTFQVLSGTGAFAGAKGKAIVVDTSDDDSDITLTYRTDGGQVSMTPSGGAETGFGSTAGTENAWLYAVGASAAGAGILVFGASARRSRRSS